MNMKWWSSLEANERRLITIAGLMLVFIVLYQFIYLSSNSAVEQARRGYADALSENAAVVEATRSFVASSEAATSNQPLQTVVTNTADAYGMTITRLIPAENDGINLWLEAEAPQTVYSWLSELERAHAVRVGKASLRRNSDEQTVSVNVYLSRPS